MTNWKSPAPAWCEQYDDQAALASRERWFERLADEDKARYVEVDYDCAASEYAAYLAAKTVQEAALARHRSVMEEWDRKAEREAVLKKRREDWEVINRGPAKAITMTERAFFARNPYYWDRYIRLGW